MITRLLNLAIFLSFAHYSWAQELDPYTQAGEAKLLFGSEYYDIQKTGMDGERVDQLLKNLGNFLEKNYGYQLDQVTLTFNRKKKKAVPSTTPVLYQGSQHKLDDLKDFYLKLHNYRMVQRELETPRCQSAVHVDLNEMLALPPELRNCSTNNAPILKQDTRDLVRHVKATAKYLTDDGTPLTLNPMSSLDGSTKEHAGNRYLQYINECKTPGKICSKKRDIKKISKKAYNLNKMQHLVSQVFLARQEKLMAAMLANTLLFDLKNTKISPKKLANKVAQKVCPNRKSSFLAWKSSKANYQNAGKLCQKHMTQFGEHYLKKHADREKNKKGKTLSITKTRKKLNKSIKRLNDKLKEMSLTVPATRTIVSEYHSDSEDECTVKYTPNTLDPRYQQTLKEYQEMYLDESIRQTGLGQFLIDKRFMALTQGQMEYEEKILCTSKAELQAKLDQKQVPFKFHLLPKIKSNKEMSNIIDRTNDIYRKQASDNAHLFAENYKDNTEPGFTTQLARKNELSLIALDMQKASDRFHEFLKQDPELARKTMLSNPSYLKQLCSLASMTNRKIDHQKKMQAIRHNLMLIAAIGFTVSGAGRLGLAGRLGPRVGLGMRQGTKWLNKKMARFALKQQPFVTGEALLGRQAFTNVMTVSNASMGVLNGWQLQDLLVNQLPESLKDWEKEKIALMLGDRENLDNYLEFKKKHEGLLKEAYLTGAFGLLDISILQELKYLRSASKGFNQKKYIKGITQIAKGQGPLKNLGKLSDMPQHKWVRLKAYATNLKPDAQRKLAQILTQPKSLKAFKKQLENFKCLNGGLNSKCVTAFDELIYGYNSPGFRPKNLDIASFQSSQKQLAQFKKNSEMVKKAPKNALSDLDQYVHFLKYDQGLSHGQIEDALKGVPNHQYKEALFSYQQSQKPLMNSSRNIAKNQSLNPLEEIKLVNNELDVLKMGQKERQEIQMFIKKNPDIEKYSLGLTPNELLIFDHIVAELRQTHQLRTNKIADDLGEIFTRCR